MLLIYLSFTRRGLSGCRDEMNVWHCSSLRSRRENIRVLLMEYYIIRIFFSYSEVPSNFHFLSPLRVPIITRARMSLSGPRRTAGSIVHWTGTDVWNDASVQYSLIVLGLKYEISLQICPEEAGTLRERSRQRIKLM